MRHLSRQPYIIIVYYAEAAQTWRLDPVDYEIWGVMRSASIQMKVQDMDDLKRRLIDVRADM